MSKQLFLELKTNNFTIIEWVVIKSFTYSKTYKLWHIHLINDDDLFIHDSNIIKLGITTDDVESIALVVNGFVKYIKPIGDEENE